MRNTLIRTLSSLALAGTIALSAGVASAHETGRDGEAPTRLTSTQSRQMRHATRQFRKVEVAVAAGYLPAETCSALPGVGAMGYHYVNPRLASDTVIDPLHPEVLLYERTRHGNLRLVGVEFFQADPDQDVTTDAGRPQLFGHPFDGPMLGHEPGMPVHFDQHVWLYKKNPAGQLAAWNPRVSCP